MKFVIQRVTHSSVMVDSKIVGQISKGFIVLIGVSNEDTKEIADKMIKKMLGLRIFEDENGKTNLSLDDVNGELLLISQFTLYADCKSRRPGFTEAARPEISEPLYELVVAECRERGVEVQTGEFGADIKVESVNDGPVTLLLDTAELGSG